MYTISKNKRKRLRTDYIIITHMRNLYEKGFFIEPTILSNNYFYTWGMWQKYFLEDLNKKYLPCHYFIEKIDDDYAVFKGLNDFQPSYFLEDLTSASIIPRMYSNAVLVCIGDDFSSYNVDKRMAEHLADKILTPLMKEYKLDFTRIKYLDECLFSDWEDNIKFSNLRYDITLAKYFNKQIIKTEVEKYKKEMR